ncbi:MAG: type II secretion system secretin GspD [Pseudomonadota bacterium]
MQRPVRRLTSVLLLPLALALPNLLGAAAVNETSAQPKLDDGKVTLNLRDADLDALIASVSEATGKNFIVDPRVKAKVNLISAKPMSADELYNVFLSVLQVHGFAAVDKGGIIKIVPDVNAKQDGVDVVAAAGSPGRGADEIVTEVVKLRHVQAAPLLTALRQLMPQQAALSVHPESNSLILTDRAGNVARMKDILLRVDVTGSDEVEIIRLKHASATDIVKTLTQLRSGARSGQASAAAGADGGNMPASFAADERSNSVLISGDKTDRAKLRAVVVYLDTPMERAGNTQVFYLKYARAKDLVPILQGSNRTVAREGSTTSGSSSGLSSGNASSFGSSSSSASSSTLNASTVGIGGRQDAVVLADEATNALVITAPPNVMRELESIINQLDIRRAQVLVEAVIAEVSEDFTKKLGVQWAAYPANGTGAVGLTTFNGLLSSIASATASSSSTTAAATAAAGVIGDGFNLGLGNVDGSGTDFAVLISALAGDANNNILSTPSLLTMDNQEASIVVGQNVPIVTGSYTNTGSSTTSVSPFQTVDREDVGVKLKVKPSISPEGAVRLELDQEVSSIDQRATKDSSAGLVTSKRNVKTAVLAQDGDVVVLGGLMDEAVQDSVSKVPLLGDIPVLGVLFSQKETTRTKRNLMVFIRPIIMRDSLSASRYTSLKYNDFREHQQRFAQNPLGFAVPGDYPMLPENTGYNMNLPSIKPAAVKAPAPVAAPSDNAE